MKNKLGFYISIFISLFLLTLILVFKTTPQTQLWKGYKILYVPKSYNSSSVLKILENENISAVVSKDNQNVPVVSKFAPIQIQTSTSYLLRREGFFSDKSNTFNVFYIPEKFAFKIPAAINTINKELSNEKQKAGTDGEGSISIFPPLIAILAFFVALYFCENKAAFSVLALSPLIFVMANPFFCVSGAFLLSLVAFYIVQKIYKRKGAFFIIRKSVLCYIFLIAPGILLAFSYIKLSLFYFMAVASSFLNFYIFMAVASFVESHLYSFNPTLILSAKSISVPGKKGVGVLMATAASIFILLVTSFFVGGISSSASTVNSSISLPLPTSKSSETNLPNVNDFSVWAWNTLAFPFKKLSTDSLSPQTTTPEEGEKIEFLGISPMDDKNMSSSYNTFVYNASFRQQLYKNASEKEGSVEKLLLTQGEKSNFGYGKQTGAAKENFKVAILTIFLFASIGATLFYSFRK